MSRKSREIHEFRAAKRGIAIRQARKELGDEAMLVGSDRANNGEFIVYAKRPPAPSEARTKPANPLPAQTVTVGGTPYRRTTKAPPQTQSKTADSGDVAPSSTKANASSGSTTSAKRRRHTVTSLHHELSAFREAVTAQLRQIAVPDELKDQATALSARLGFDPLWMEELVCNEREQAQQGFIPWLSRKLNAGVKTLSAQPPLQGIHIIVGQGGSGKTTLASALLVQAVAEHAPGGVCAISTDGARFCGAEQFLRAAETLGVEAIFAPEPGQLKTALMRARGRAFTIIDTAALTPSANAASHLLSEMRVTMTVPAYYSEPDCRRALTLHGQRLDDVVVTQADVACQGGGVVQWLHDSGVALAGVRNSSDITDPLAPADVAQLLNLGSASPSARHINPYRSI